MIFSRTCLQRKNVEAGDHLEVAHVEGGYLETEFESRYSDGQVFEGEDDSFGRLLALDASDAAGDLQGYGMDRNITAQLLDERQSPQATRITLGAIGSMHQLSDGDNGETDIDFTVDAAYLFEDARDRCGKSACTDRPKEGSGLWL